MLAITLITLSSMNSASPVMGFQRPSSIRGPAVLPQLTSILTSFDCVLRGGCRKADLKGNWNVMFSRKEIPSRCERLQYSVAFFNAVSSGSPRNGLEETNGSVQVTETCDGNTPKVMMGQVVKQHPFLTVGLRNFSSKLEMEKVWVDDNVVVAAVVKHTLVYDYLSGVHRQPQDFVEQRTLWLKQGASIFGPDMTEIIDFFHENVAQAIKLSVFTFLSRYVLLKNDVEFIMLYDSSQYTFQILPFGCLEN
jgi:hypothetical protein